MNLAHMLHTDVPAFPGRTYTQALQPDQDPVGINRLHQVVEQIIATQQMGTHIDGRSCSLGLRGGPSTARRMS